MAKNKEIEKFHRDIQDTLGIVNSRNAVNMVFTSIGCHYLNLLQKSDTFQSKVYKNGSVVDMRKHLLFIRPAGFGKTTILKNLYYDIIPDVSRYRTNEAGKKVEISTFQNVLTEAGFSGTVTRGSNGDIDRPEGIAQQCSKGFVVVEEFSAIMETFGQQHSSSFEQVLLMALDSGRVTKSLANGTISYHTNMTMAAGIQPTKAMNTSSGLMRRYLCEFYMPDIAASKNIIKKNRESWKQQSNSREGYLLKERLKEYIEKDVMDNTFYTTHIDDSVFDYMDEYQMPAGIESDIYMQSIHGYNYFKNNIEGGELIVELDQNLKDMIYVDAMSRKLLGFNMHAIVVLMIIKNMVTNGASRKTVKPTEVYANSGIYQLNNEEITAAFKKLEEMHIVKKMGTDAYAILNAAYFEEITDILSKVQKVMQ